MDSVIQRSGYIRFIYSSNAVVHRQILSSTIIHYQPRIALKSHESVWKCLTASYHVLKVITRDNDRLKTSLLWSSSPLIALRWQRIAPQLPKHTGRIQVIEINVLRSLILSLLTTIWWNSFTMKT